MTGEPTIDYDALALEAMRGLVRSVLARTAKSGLPGDHHFYVSFDTEHPGINLSRRLKERYPREMTIVLQHRFWDLAVHEDRFEVKLTFDGIPERLVVPFSAIKVFFDPSVQYGLRFEDGEPADPADITAPSPGNGTAPRTVAARTAPKRPKSGPKKPKSDREGLVAVATAQSTPASSSTASGSKPVPLSRPQPALAPVASAPPPAATPVAAGAESGSSDTEPKPANSGAQILSLDQFRKK